MNKQSAILFVMYKSNKIRMNWYRLKNLAKRTKIA